METIDYIMKTVESLRNHPNLDTLFKDAESRFLSEDELEIYLTEFPEGESRSEASREIKQVTNQIVKKVISRIYEIYPYEQKHQMAMAKCMRDVRYVITYATLAMLMRDPDWYRDKLLVWMKTIIQSFGYPDIPDGSFERYFSDSEILAHLETLRPNQRSIYETYRAILEEMNTNLPSEAFDEIESYLKQALNILSGN